MVEVRMAIKSGNSDAVERRRREPDTRHVEPDIVVLRLHHKNSIDYDLTFSNPYQQ
jgi:hypothetical protein